MNAFEQLAKDIGKRVPRKDLARLHGHAVAVSRLHVHGLLSKSDAHRINAKIIKQIQALKSK